MRIRRRDALAAVLLASPVAWACSPKTERTKPAAAAGSAGEPAPGAPTPAYETALPPAVRTLVDKPFTVDFDQMVQHRLIRVGAPFNRTFYFIDNGVQRGLSYEYASMFEEDINKQLNTGALKVHVVLIPMARDVLLDQLRSGKIDMVIAQLTVTPERQKLVDFSTPTRTNVDEVLVTGPAAKDVRAIDDLGEHKVFVRQSSSYFASLTALNAQRAAQGKPAIAIKTAPENLEDDDLLEMVNAGLIPATIVDNYLAHFWAKVFPALAVHDDITFRTGGVLAVAIRKNSPKLAAELNGFIAAKGLSSAIGHVLDAKYLQRTDFVKGSASAAERKKFLDMVALFRKYGDQYSFDYLLMAAQGYQESRLDQHVKSRVGAIGVMQLMPKTGQSLEVGDIRQLEPNIHAGVKYMRQMRDQNFENEPMDNLNKALFTFAAYNAGVGRIRQLRQEAGQRGLNPNVWFGNVERVASERIGRETVTYVSNIYKYYIAYKLISEENQARAATKEALAAKGGA